MMHIAVLLKTKSKKTRLHPNFAQQETAYKKLLPTAKVLAIWVLGPNPHGTPGNDRVPTKSLPLCFHPRAHASKSSIRKRLFCRRLLAKLKGTAHSAHVKSRFQTIKLSLRFLRLAIGTRITGASQAAVVFTTEAGAFRSEAAGHSAI